MFLLLLHLLQDRILLNLDQIPPLFLSQRQPKLFDPFSFLDGRCGPDFRVVFSGSRLGATRRAFGAGVGRGGGRCARIICRFAFAFIRRSFGGIGGRIRRRCVGLAWSWRIWGFTGRAGTLAVVRSLLG